MPGQLIQSIQAEITVSYRAEGMHSLAKNVWGVGRVALAQRILPQGHRGIEQLAHGSTLGVLERTEEQLNCIYVALSLQSAIIVRVAS